jgi:hypothetical protein
MKYSLDKRVVFNEENHSYFLKDKKLVSVTTFIGKFKNEFDSNYWSKVIAKRENKTQEQILSQWKEKAKKACEIGTAIHKIFEEYILGNFIVLNNEIKIDFIDLEIDYFLDFNKKSKVAIQFIKDFFITKRLIPVHTEYIVYNDKLAGQIDLICKDQKENYYILDFKTNEKIEVNNYGKYLKDDLSHMPDCSFYHYSLQLSIYKQLTKEDIKGLFLIHIADDKYNFIECVDIFNSYNITLEELLKSTLPNYKR